MDERSGFLTGLAHLHSTLRYFIVILVVAAIITSLMGWLNKKPYTPGNKKLALFSLIFVHIQLVLGLLIYVMGKYYKGFQVMKALKQIGAGNDVIAPIRFYTIEHISMMIIAIALITIGYSTSKRAATDEAKHKKIAVFYLIGFLIMFFAIPWPFLKSWASWF